MIPALLVLAGALLGTLVLSVVLDRVLAKHGDPRFAERLRKVEERLDHIEGALHLLPRLYR